MITKEQWQRFCWDLYETKKDLGCRWGDISLHGRPVAGVNLTDYTIRTNLQGTPTTVYKYKDSLSDNTQLKHLYRLVSVKTDMERQIGRAHV